MSHDQMQRERGQRKMKIRIVVAPDTDGKTKEGRTPEQAGQRVAPAAIPMAPDIPEPSEIPTSSSR